MAQYTSYYLYERYEKRGEQDWIPCYPNTYSISGDVTNPMSLVVKSENDTQCGYTPTPTEPMYRWVNLDPSTDYYCDGVAKYYKQQRQVSYDAGTTWSNLDEYQRGSQYEASSSDCGGGTTMYRWVASGETYCKNDYLTQLYKKQVSYNNGSTWTDVIPIETKEESTSESCPIYYRWVDTNIEGCDGCELGEGVKSFIVGNRTIPNSNQGATYYLSFDNNVTQEDLLVGHRDQYTSWSGGTALCLGEGVTDANVSDKRAITSLVLPSTLTGCSISEMMSLKELVLPIGITSIGREMFYYCSSLTTLIIGSGCTYIGDYAFNYCANLRNIIIQAATPPTLGFAPFTRTSDVVIFVPRESLDQYKNEWGNNLNIQSFN